MPGKGRPFQPGQSGNISGRPKIAEHIKALARQHTERAIETLVAALDDEDGRVRVVAANSLLDRGWGKPSSIDEESIMRDFLAQASAEFLIAKASEVPALPPHEDDEE